PVASRRKANDQIKRTVVSSERRAAHRAQRTLAALALTLVEARDQRAGRRIGLLQRHRAIGITADLVAHALHPALALRSALLARGSAQCCLDRTPMHQLLGAQMQRSAQTSDLTFSNCYLLCGSRRGPKSLFRNQQWSHHRERERAREHCLPHAA